MKKLLSFLLIFYLVFLIYPLKLTLSEENRFPAEINFNLEENYFFINGYKLYFDDANKSLKPVIKYGRTFVPLRSIVESIGGEVFWREKTREVEVKFKKNIIVLTIDKNSAFVNGKVKKIDENENVVPIIIYSRTYIPLRFIIENLGGEINYNSLDRSINIKIDRETMEVIDSMGRKVLVPKKIYRIISLYPMSTIILLSLKVQDKLIGSKIAGAKVINQNNLSKIFPEYQNLQDVGSFKDYNPETLLKVNPDLIITPHFTNIKKLEEIDLPVLLLNHEYPEELIKSIKILGKILCKEKDAEEITNYYDTMKSYIEEKLKVFSFKKRVYVTGETIFKSFGSDFYQTFMVDIAGGVSVTKDIKGGKIEISLEDLIRFNPEYIFFPSYFIGTKEDILNKKELQDIKAVKEKKVFAFPSFLLSYDLPSVESILGIVWLSQKINGDILKIDLRKEIKYFYKMVFNYNLSNEEIEDILKE